MVPLPVLVPLFSAGAALALGRHPRIARAIALAALSISLAVALILIIVVDSHALALDIGSWAAPVGITLVVDRFSALMLTVSVAVTLAVLVYSTAQGVADEDEGAPVAVFYPTFLVLSAGVSNAFLTGDLFNLYVGFEILLAASFVLITLGGSRDRIRSGTIYVVVSLVSSVLFLLSIALIYAAVGTVSFAHLAERLADLDPSLRTILHLMLLAAFGIKAAVFPLSAWLPDSYPTAPAPVTAVFAGLLTKVGVYAMIRTETLLFPGGDLDTLLAWVALATMIVGILGAVAQNDLKRMLSFTLVSHIGFMVWGISTNSQAGLSAAVFYVVHHITVQTSLFLVAGLVERYGGTTSLIRLGSLASAIPFVAALYLIPALNLAGIPPLTGFIGKVGLLEAAAASGTALDYALIAGALITSILTLYAVVKAWNMAFWQKADEPMPETRLPASMVGAATSLVVLAIGLTLGGGRVVGYTDAAAENLRNPRYYVQAVLPDGLRGQGTSDSTTETTPREEEHGVDSE
ncbi:Na+/H+ antiporter subunit D [Bowdeniella nasicola]|uniref:Na+/H+ antiporter subunit D n=2 Tax=Bowdeniella nasicola TaxID=208480 RepID=A0A1Q5Q1V1_9ACTO|nr:Na+/H+ antiporter subunit D [Bowdeniella nasicola]